MTSPRPTPPSHPTTTPGPMPLQNARRDAELDPWRFTQAEVQRSPSRCGGLPPRFEAECHLRATVYMREIGQSLGIPALTTSVAGTFMRRFFMLESILDHDMAYVSAACLFLACKTCETHKRLKDFVNQAVAIRYRAASGADTGGFRDVEGTHLYEAERSALLKKETEVMRTLNFDLIVDQPLSHLPPLTSFYVNALDVPGIGGKKLASMRKMACQMAWNFIVESCGSFIHLQFDSREIATAAVFLGVAVAGFPVQSENPAAPKYYTLYKCDARTIGVICDVMLKNCSEEQLGSNLRRTEFS